jgi:hypothetical protein
MNMARNKIGIGHDGTHNAFAKPGEPTLVAAHSGMAARAHDQPGLGIARNGSPKRFPDVPYHNGMPVKAIVNAGIGGIGHGVASLGDGGQVVSVSSAAVPPVPAHRRGFNSVSAPQPSQGLTHAYGSVLKVREAAPISPGMKNRTGAIARSLADATPTSIGRELLDQGK